MQGGAPLAKGVPSHPLPFTSAGFCQPTGVRLEAGAQYRLQLQLPDTREWRDGGIQVKSPAGFTSVDPQLSVTQRVLFNVFLPFRRLWTAVWFEPVARIDERGGDQYALNATSTEITARTSGELFMFVNDAIVPIRLLPPSLGWTSYYENNHGTANRRPPNASSIHRPHAYNVATQERAPKPPHSAPVPDPSPHTFIDTPAICGIYLVTLEARSGAHR